VDGRLHQPVGRRCSEGELGWALAVFVCALAAPVAAGCGGSGGDGGDDGGGGERADAHPSGLARYSLLVRGEPYAAMVVEIDAVPGMEPFTQNVNRLPAVLDELVDKPAGIAVELDGQLDSLGADYAWTFGELTALAEASFDRELPSGSIGIHILFVDGHSAEDTGEGVILGLAWGHTHVAMFKQTIEKYCASTAIPPLLREDLCRGAELSIWIHELGHVLGLVDNGLPMVEPHRDAEHGAHDQSDDCVMYWAYQGEALFDTLAERLISGGNDVLPFDQACLADLAAERAR
jgi:hypothetical protein